MDIYNLVMYVLFGILISIFVVFSLILVNSTLKRRMKNTAPSRKDFEFYFHGRKWKVECPELDQSTYWDRTVKPGSYWSYLATLDCFAMRELAKTIDRMLDGKSDRYKAEFILAMVQQNCKYVHDSELYGKRDHHAFPVCTAYLKKGDCEDSAALGACLSALCGLHTILCLTSSHMAYAVEVEGKGFKVTACNHEYIWCESTGVSRVGMVSEKPVVKYNFGLMYPPQFFIEDCTIVDEFNKYVE